VRVSIWARQLVDMKSPAPDETLSNIDPGADCSSTALMAVEVQKNSALYPPTHFPDCGFVEQASFPGGVLRMRAIGRVDRMEDSKRDHKLLAVPERRPRYEEIRGPGDVPPHPLEGKTGELPS